MKKEQPKKWRNFAWQDFESQAIERLQNGEELGGKDGVLAHLIKRLLEASLRGCCNPIQFTSVSPLIRFQV